MWSMKNNDRIEKFDSNGNYLGAMGQCKEAAMASSDEPT